MTAQAPSPTHRRRIARERRSIWPVFIAGFGAAWLLAAPLSLAAQDQRRPAGLPPPAPELAPKRSTAAAAAEDGPAVAPKPAPARPEDLPAAFDQAVPVTLEDLQAIEQHVRDLVARVSPTVVEVEVGGATGSGVVISQDGLVLSVAHVGAAPGRKVRFTFPGGKTALGKTLGMNHEQDAGLMQITDKGPWPHAAVGELDHARLGDWVLALGHPGGFDPQRPVVARLGRIIGLTLGLLQTDCPLIGGDSGGPLFDMHGRVIAVHSRITDSASENFHVPITAFRESWDRLAKGDNWGGRTLPPRPYVGARGVDDPEGCRLEQIDEPSPAARAGLKVGDVVTKVNDEAVADYRSFRRCLRETKPGEVARVEVKRGDLRMTLMVTVEARRDRRRRPR